MWNSLPYLIEHDSNEFLSLTSVIYESIRNSYAWRRKDRVYNDNLSQLKLDRTTNVVTFFENRSGEETLLYTNNLTQTFGQMKRLGGWQMGVSLFSVDLNNNLVEYVRYVDSYPILSSGKEGFTQIKVNSTGIEKMRTSSLIAQTPLPTKK